MIRRVEVAALAQKQLSRVPQHIALKMQVWIDAVEVHGLEVVRRVPGFHDEPLKGARTGQRSIRLSRSYRAIYEIHQDEEAVSFVRVEEVSKHDY